MYLYHQVPKDVRGTSLKPLNDLWQLHPDICQRAVQKYAGREQVMEQVLPKFNCLWNDVLHFTAVHPTKVRQAMREVGFTVFDTAEFYEIEARILAPDQTVVYLCRHEADIGKMSAENFAEYDPSKISEYAEVPDATKAYYKAIFRLKKRPLLYQYIPHILYRGNIQLLGIRIVTV